MKVLPAKSIPPAAKNAVEESGGAHTGAVPSSASAATSELLKNQERLNAERLARDLAEGLRELLELHNSEELKILCRTLGATGKGPSSKRANIERIFNSIIKTDDDYQKVLRSVWDGIIIEYLRGVGKNLMRCKDNLRAAVINHWRRHAVFKVEVKGERPVFVNDTRWRRKGCTSATDAAVEAKLKELQRIEIEWKESERRLRVQADYASVVDYLSKVYNVRRVEEGVRDYLLTSLQKALDMYDGSLDAEKKAKAAMRRAQMDLAGAVKGIRTKESFHSAMLDSYCNASAVEKIHWGVNRVQLNNTIVDLHSEIDALNAAHAAETNELLGRIDGLKEEARQMEKRMDELNVRAKKHQDVVDALQSNLGAATSERDFLRMRCTEYHDYIKQSMARELMEDVKHDAYFAIAANRSASSLHYQKKSKALDEYSARRAEESERWQMCAAELEARYLPKIKKKKKKKGRKGRSKSKGRGKSRGRSVSPSKKKPTSRGRSKTPKASKGAKRSQSAKGTKGKSASRPKSKSKKRSKSPTKKKRKK